MTRSSSVRFLKAVNTLAEFWFVTTFEGLTIVPIRLDYDIGATKTSGARNMSQRIRQVLDKPLVYLNHFVWRSN